jgi:hypothetical protein
LASPSDSVVEGGPGLVLVHSLAYPLNDFLFGY